MFLAPQGNDSTLISNTNNKVPIPDYIPVAVHFQLRMYTETECGLLLAATNTTVMVECKDFVNASRKEPEPTASSTLKNIVYFTMNSVGFV